jgi:glucokinase
MKYNIGIDLGGTAIKYGLVSTNGQLIFESQLPTQADCGAEAVILNIIKAAKMVQQKALELNIELLAIGIGTPGIVDKTNRIVLGGADNIVGWINVMLADKVEEACQLPTYISNDANLMGLGEQAYGAAKDCSDVLFLTVGTGIGGAIIIDGKLFGGYDNRGTELGHIPLFMDGIPCSCGSVGCLEAYASTSALIQQFEDRCKQLNTKFDGEITGKLIANFYKNNNSIAVECLNNHWAYLGRGIAGLVNIFSPQRVVIGGGISEAGDFYLKNLDKEFRKYVMPDCAVNSQLCLAQLGNKAGILGASKYAFSSIKN